MYRKDESETTRHTENAMAKRKRTNNDQQNTTKTLHRKLEIDQHEPQ